jgi:glycosyltransferase involved in cell wall biosynthesis
MNTRTGKIACSVGILTLNSEKGLSACLDSLKDFAEIIVCDGNSTDRTREIAIAAGARVIRQYETDAAHTPCIKDKATVRQKNMDAATHDWYFYMDADDTLSSEVVEEIRSIVSRPITEHSGHLIYRMPTRIFFESADGTSVREIKHEATYPSYQTRLVHRSVKAHFKGQVHDRLVFDAKRFPVGTMKGYYNFHWSAERVTRFWNYLGRYADWEIQVARPGTFGNFLYWGLYRRIRTIVGYVFYRLPAMYIRYGFKDSMPLGIELTIVRYHCKIVWGDMRTYVTSRYWWIYIREVLRGKDTNRILTNIALMKKSCMGSILDIGGGKKRASHYRFLDMSKWHTITTVDISKEAEPDYVLNIEKEKLPFNDQSFDYVFLMNVLEHLNNRVEVLSEIHRVLKSVRSDAGMLVKGIQTPADTSGELVGVIPFLVNVHPDPHDFVRLTEEGLRDIFGACGFSKVMIRPVGAGPCTAGYYQIEYILPRCIRLLVGPMFLGLDAFMRILSGRSLADRFPLSYIFHASR